MGLLNSLLGFFNLEAAPAGTKSSLTECTVSEAHLQTELSGTSKNLDTANSALNVCTQDGTVQQQAIVQQAATIQNLNSQVKDLTAKLAAGIASIYQKPCPAILKQVAPSQVMLGDFVIITGQGTFTFQHNCHASMFALGPYLEFALSAMDLNRPRPDLTDIEFYTNAANYFQTHMTYIDDQTQWKRPDNWTPTQSTYYLGKDNCENLAALCNSLAYYHELKFGMRMGYSAVQALGHLKIGGQPYGHSFVAILSHTSTSMNDNYIIEATLTYAASAMSMSEAKDTYDMAWGLFGYTRADFPDATYWINDNISWWGTAGNALTGCECRRCLKQRGKAAQAAGIVKKAKNFILRRKPEHQIKLEHVHKLWAYKRRG